MAPLNVNNADATEIEALGSGPGYVLMTAAYNEEAFIEKTLASILAQTSLPRRWVIVSDNSTDGTDAIIERYAKQHRFIRFLRVTRAPVHSFSAKIVALRKASSLLQDVPYEFIGNLDADVTVEPSYFADLMAHFAQFPRLGLISGFIHEENANGEFRSRSSNRIGSVPHAAQLLRRECYEVIGGYSVLKYGGEDWYAQTCARMNGWDIEAIPAFPVFHHRRTGAAAHLLRHRFQMGKLDYSFGSHPAFELVKCLLRLPEPPVVLGAMYRLLGYVWSYLCHEPRVVSEEFAAFLRKEQTGRFWSFFRRFESLGAEPAQTHRDREKGGFDNETGIASNRAHLLCNSRGK